MFYTAAGVRIPYPKKIKEKYELGDSWLDLNLSFEKLEPMLYDFIDMIEEPLFLALHIPLTLDEEHEINKSETKSLHQKVCYLDGQTKTQLKSILLRYGEFLLNDGMSEFAVASHKTGEEFFVRKYKIVQIYSQQPIRFERLLKKYGLKKTKKLKTVWDTFSYDSPGECWRYEKENMSIFEVYEELVEAGMYHAKTIEE